MSKKLAINYMLQLHVTYFAKSFIHQKFNGVYFYLGQTPLHKSVVWIISCLHCGCMYIMCPMYGWSRDLTFSGSNC